MRAMRLMAVITVLSLATPNAAIPVCLFSVAHAQGITGPCDGNCTPGELGLGNRLDTVNGGNINVCFQSSPGFSSDERDGLMDGFAYWSGYLSSHEELPQVSFHSDPNEACNLTILAVDLLDDNIVAQANGTNGGNTQNVTLFINRNRVDSVNHENAHSRNYWGWVGAHESGHLLDIAHSSQCNRAQSVMVPSLPEDLDEAISSALGCADSSALSEIYLNTNTNFTGGGGYADDTRQMDDLGVECTYHWIVTDYYYWTPQGWHYWFTYWAFQWMDNCTELECC